MAASELQAQARFAHAAAGNAGVQLDDEERWVRQSLEQETAGALGAAAKVFDVPRDLRVTKPEAYMPHRFALGPYHQGRCDLMDMERYKLAAAKRQKWISCYSDFKLQLKREGERSS